MNQLEGGNFEGLTDVSNIYENQVHLSSSNSSKFKTIKLNLKDSVKLFFTKYIPALEYVFINGQHL